MITSTDAALSRLPGRSASGRALRDTVVISRRNLRRILRTPQLLAFSSLLPISFTLLFRYVLGGAVHTGGERYIDYMLPTMLVLSTMFGATGAIAMAVDVTGGMVDRSVPFPSHVRSCSPAEPWPTSGERR